MKTSKRVTILTINDFHAKHDQETISVDGRRCKVGGSVRLANCLFAEREKAKADGSVVLSFVVGDMFLGSDYFTYYDGEVEMKLLNLLEFDAFAVGNHDFDQGGIPNLLIQAKHAPNMSLLCANVYNSKNEPLFPPYKVYDENGVRIAVVALMGQDAWTAIPHSLKEGLVWTNILDCAKEIRRHIEGSFSSIDFWVCLSHSGINQGDTELAESGLFDAIFSGHEHFVALQDWIEIKNQSNVCYLHAGNCNGRAVTKLDLEISRDGSRRIEGTTLELIQPILIDNISDVTSKVNELLEHYQANIEDIAGEVIAVCHSHEYSKEYLGLNFCPITPLPISTIVLDAFFHAYSLSERVKQLSLPENRLFAAFNFGSLRGALPKGNVSIKHVCTVLPFNGEIEIIRLEGATVARMMKRNLDRAEARKPGKAPGMGYHFKWLCGVAPEVEPSDLFYMVTTKYIRENDIFPLLEGQKADITVPDKVIWSIEEENLGSIRGIRDALVELIRTRAVLH